MPDINTLSSLYEPIIKSIAFFDEGQKAIADDKASMISFAENVVNGEAGISKFVQAKTQVETYLDRYDFKGGFQFDEMNKKIDSLLLLRSKLATMGVEAKKLSVYPDRYGSQRTIEQCQDLAIKCRDKLKLEEAEKAVALVEEYTQKLISIRSQFESDGDVLYQINEAIDSDMNVLGKFKAYLAEIRQYVDAFPHSGQDDLGEIKNRINAAKKINKLFEEAKKSVDSIKGYADRHNKKSVVSHFQTIVNEMYSKMQYADIKNYTSELESIKEQVKKVVSAFDKDKKELEEIYNSLSSRSCDKWKEDTERMIEEVWNLLNSDTKLQSFNLSKLKRDIEGLVLNRNQDIKNTVNDYPWLNNRWHEDFHYRLVHSYITKSDYLYEIDCARIERLKNIWKWVGIGTGIALIIIILCISPIVRWIAVAIVVIALIIKIKDG